MCQFRDLSLNETLRLLLMSKEMEKKHRLQTPENAKEKQILNK